MKNITKRAFLFYFFLTAQMIQRLVPEICIKHLHVFLLADCLISFDTMVLIVEGTLNILDTMKFEVKGTVLVEHWWDAVGTENSAVWVPVVALPGVLVFLL